MIQIEQFEVPYFPNRESESWRVLKIYSQVMPSLDLDDEQDVDQLMEQLDGQQTHVARDEDGLIVGVSTHYLPKQEDYLFLSGLAVAKERQRTAGVGRQILSHLGDLAVAEGRIAIECNAIDSAVGFYAKLGASTLNSAGTTRFRIEL